MESRLRLLVARLEQTQNVKYAVPYVDGCVDKSSPQQFNCHFFLGLTFDFSKSEPVPRNEQANKSVDLNPAVVSFKMQIMDWHVRSPGMEVNVKCLKRYTPNRSYPIPTIRSFIDSPTSLARLRDVWRGIGPNCQRSCFLAASVSALALRLTWSHESAAAPRLTRRHWQPLRPTV